MLKMVEYGIFAVTVLTILGLIVSSQMRTSRDAAAPAGSAVDEAADRAAAPLGSAKEKL
ncbi:MAG TPA: hypothetical protein VGD64_07715 [Acidisarcina sp.]